MVVPFNENMRPIMAGVRRDFDQPQRGVDRLSGALEKCKGSDRKGAIFFVTLGATISGIAV